MKLLLRVLEDQPGVCDAVDRLGWYIEVFAKPKRTGLHLDNLPGCDGAMDVGNGTHLLA